MDGKKQPRQDDRPKACKIQKTNNNLSVLPHQFDHNTLVAGLNSKSWRVAICCTDVCVLSMAQRRLLRSVEGFFMTFLRHIVAYVEGGSSKLTIKASSLETLLLDDEALLSAGIFSSAAPSLSKFS